MKQGTFDPPELIPYLYGGVDESYRKSGTAFDVGCSVGNTITNLMPYYNKVIGFEPSTIALHYLNTVPSIKGVQVYPLAISDHEGRVELHLPEGKCRVNCRSIDSLTTKLPMPDFIRVNAPNHELQVLRGAEFTMISRASEWLIEIHEAAQGQKVQTLLNQYGYKNTLILDRNDTTINHFWIRAAIAQ